MKFAQRDCPKIRSGRPQTVSLEPTRSQRNAKLNLTDQPYWHSVRRQSLLSLTSHGARYFAAARMCQGEIHLRLPPPALFSVSERGVRILLPDGKILGGDGEPSKFEHMATRFGHSSSLSPYDLVDRRFRQGMCPGLCPRLDSSFGSSEFGSDLGRRVPTQQVRALSVVYR
jgi:hypothetical protein